MKPDRYEIVPRPSAVGGGWRLHLIGRDPETGQELELGGGVFPVQDGQDDADAYNDAMQTGQDWLHIDGSEVESESTAV